MKKMDETKQRLMKLTSNRSANVTALKPYFQKNLNKFLQENVNRISGKLMPKNCYIRCPLVCRTSPDSNVISGCR